MFPLTDLCSMRTIEYFFTVQSPWSYIGHAAFLDVAKRQGSEIAFRPMNLGKVFPESGGLPLAKRHPARQRYRLIELQRWILKRNLPAVLHPKYWPLDPSLADKTIIAMVEAGATQEMVGRVLGRFFSGIFEREENIASMDEIAAILTTEGQDAEALLAAVSDDKVEGVYAENAADALSRGAVGAPTYCLDGEIFWGQDRLELLEDALASGRQPFSSDV